MARLTLASIETRGAPRTPHQEAVSASRLGQGEGRALPFLRDVASEGSPEKPGERNESRERKN